VDAGQGDGIAEEDADEGDADEADDEDDEVRKGSTTAGRTCRAKTHAGFQQRVVFRNITTYDAEKKEGRNEEG
jgi:hypothetical protein